MQEIRCAIVHATCNSCRASRSTRDPTRTKRFVHALALTSDVRTTRAHQTKGKWHYDSSEKGCMQPIDKETLLAQTRQRLSCAALALVLYICMLERLFQAQRHAPRKHLVRCKKLHKDCGPSGQAAGVFRITMIFSPDR